MSWRSYTEIYPRWSHIDATLVSMHAATKGGKNEAEITVSLYPWWEHPRYLELASAGKPWKFEASSLPAREVVVRGVDVQGAMVRPCTDVIDWTFREHGPRAWDFERDFVLLANASFDFDAFVDRVSRRAGVHPSEIAARIARPLRFPASVGALPGSVFEIARQELDALGGRSFVPSTPPASRRLITFECDAGWIVAGDFLVDAPDFDHSDVEVVG